MLRKVVKNRYFHADQDKLVPRLSTPRGTTIKPVCEPTPVPVLWPAVPTSGRPDTSDYCHGIFDASISRSWGLEVA